MSRCGHTEPLLECPICTSRDELIARIRDLEKRNTEMEYQLPIAKRAMHNLNQKILDDCHKITELQAVITNIADPEESELFVDEDGNGDFLSAQDKVDVLIKYAKQHSTGGE